MFALLTVTAFTMASTNNETIIQNNARQGLRWDITSPDKCFFPDRPNVEDILEGEGLIPSSLDHLSPDDMVFVLIQWLYRSLADTSESNEYGDMVYPGSIPEETLRQRLIRLVLTAMLGHGRIPRQEQIDTVHDLIFKQLDIILIARTSFGKTLIIQAYSLITDRITILISPLVKLAEEQRNSLLAIPRATPLLITADTRKADPKMFERVGAGAHSHIVLGPEQTQSDLFQQAIRTPAFEQRCGLVAIDEAHLLSEWAEFRSAYIMLRNLRFVLPRYVHWFACTATASEETLTKIMKHGGFRHATNHNHNGYVVDVRRYSVDRPEIDLGVFPIQRGQLLGWEYLGFLIDEAPKPSPLQQRRKVQSQMLLAIPKTIVYIDSKAKTLNARGYLIDLLVEKGYSKYATRLAIKFYHSIVPQGDQSRIYTDFKTTSSRCRIIISTVALGLGMDIPDVMRVVQWGIPRSLSLEDIWQRIGRCVRGHKSLGMTRNGQGIIFAPYWAFDQYGTSTADSRQRALAAVGDVGELTHSERRPDTGELEIDVAPTDNEDSESDDNGDLNDQEDGGDGLVASARTGSTAPTRKPQKWGKQELKNRAKIGENWHALFNGSCIRKSILAALCNDQAASANEDAATPAPCCNHCTPGLVVVPEPVFKPAKKRIVKPKKNSLRELMLGIWEGWCDQRTGELYPSDMYALGGIGLQWSFIPVELKYSVFNCFEGLYARADRHGFPHKSPEELVAAIPELENWKY